MNVLYTELPVQGIPAQIVFIVGKKRFKRAVDRNRMKRLMRELYRTQKYRIYDVLKKRGRTAALALFYSGNGLMELRELEPAFEKLLKKLLHEMAV